MLTPDPNFLPDMLVPSWNDFKAPESRRRQQRETVRSNFQVEFGPVPFHLCAAFSDNPDSFPDSPSESYDRKRKANENYLSFQIFEYERFGAWKGYAKWWRSSWSILPRDVLTCARVEGGILRMSPSSVPWKSLCSLPLDRRYYCWLYSWIRCSGRFL